MWFNLDVCRRRLEETSYPGSGVDIRDRGSLADVPRSFVNERTLFLSLLQPQHRERQPRLPCLLSHHGDGVWSEHVLLLWDFSLTLYISSSEASEEEEAEAGEQRKYFHVWAGLGWDVRDGGE